MGSKTAADAVAYSKGPVAYTHCLPAALKAHPRNKSDAQLRAIVDKGGFVGVTMFPPFLKKGAEATLDDIVQAIDCVVNIVGEDKVGIGTDFTQRHSEEFFRYITHDKGDGRRLTDFGYIVMPTDFCRLDHFPNLTAALQRNQWPEERIRKIMGANWLKFLSQIWSS